jgi:hypothetical protein
MIRAVRRITRIFVYPAIVPAVVGFAFTLAVWLRLPIVADAGHVTLWRANVGWLLHGSRCTLVVTWSRRHQTAEAWRDAVWDAGDFDDTQRNTDYEDLGRTTRRSAVGMERISSAAVRAYAYPTTRYAVWAPRWVWVLVTISVVAALRWGVRVRPRAADWDLAEDRAAKAVPPAG